MDLTALIKPALHVPTDASPASRARTGLAAADTETKARRNHRNNEDQGSI